MNSLSDEEILLALKNQDIPVQAVRRLSKSDTSTSRTPSYLLSFTTQTLPETINIFYGKIPVSTYFPFPLRCRQCLKYGHSLPCSKPKACFNCAKDHHDLNGKDCKSPVKCVACESDQHNVLSSDCPRYKLECKAVKMSIENGITVPDARKFLRTSPSRYTGDPTHAPDAYFQPMPTQESVYNTYRNPQPRLQIINEETETWQGYSQEPAHQQTPQWSSIANSQSYPPLCAPSRNTLPQHFTPTPSIEIRETPISQTTADQTNVLFNAIETLNTNMTTMTLTMNLLMKMMTSFINEVMKTPETPKSPKSKGKKLPPLRLKRVCNKFSLRSPKINSTLPELQLSHTSTPFTSSDDLKHDGSSHIQEPMAVQSEPFQNNPP